MSSNLAPGLNRKLRKVLETRTDSPELLASLTTLSSFYNENTLQARRNLRSTIEKRGLSINEQFLRASEAAQKALDAVDHEVSGLAECCDRIAKSLSTCSATTGDIVTATERLKLELETTTQRQDLIANFLHNYQLSPEEVNALREEELNENFFKALARVQEIHANCKVLLRTHQQRAGLELMDMMAAYQEGAYERLCRWVQNECRSLGDNDTPEVSDLLKIAARSLRERPVLFKYCAEEVANTRHNALFRRFISALTRGGPGGMPRPIEVHAHDPLRYVGDMLAWLHQALASERELATALFSSDANAVVDSTSQRFTTDSSRLASKTARYTKEVEKDDGKVEADMTFVLDRVFEGVCRPFKVRVEQVLQSQPGLILAYKLTNLLEFYSHTVSDLLGENAALSVTVRDVRDAALRTFFDILKARGDKLLRYPSSVAVDLSPPPAVAEGVSVLLELIDNYNRMMVPAGGKKPDFEPVINAIVEPLVQMCERAAEAYGLKSPLPGMRRINSGEGRKLPNLSPPPRRTTSVDTLASGLSSLQSQGVHAFRRIFLVNCLSAIQQPLVGSEVARSCVKYLGSAIEGHIAGLVDQEVGVILERCGLQKKVSYIKERSTKGEIVPKEEEVDDERPMAEIDEMSPTAVADSLKLFLGLLAGSEGGPLPEFEQMQVPRLRSEAANQVARALADAYETVYLAVLDPSNRYPEPKAMLRHTPEQIRTILGV
ncbi:conserved oligomeric Golgi complex subunit 6 [Marchantia polymorpha subsp. ruderalis]|uniref:Conserved oligomeric Golgi complex subunit 6 n=2 Tax=Marchantia polymorpha TaxID=3197 RepID=A0A176VJL8_MARPO|nr:hypothetical protein AXG93_3873s1100 [Marchantia polymorpha subsp. ruderalis]PTQ47144.1 hypothetical protein MARPO_0009s0222 [Marchantia polymorpha]BBN17538.1 hypothetical protein Mp_7g15380 [Marchantia polymorpha subsp. ruderalis]|eukprot:PTQ47144.1 hypothetical protein MARPO_0009s0222 [Marchantia polymorpha]